MANVAVRTGTVKPRTRTYVRRRKTRTANWIRRQTKRFVRRHFAAIILMTPLIIGILTGIFIGVKASAYARSTRINDYGRQMVFTTYRVKTGDTIWEIASDLAALNPEFNDVRQYMAAIMKANRMGSGEIRSGQIILIPYFINMDGMNDDEIRAKYGIDE